MYTVLIISVLVSVLFVYYTIHYYKYGFLEAIFMSFLGFLTGGFLSMVILTIATRFIPESSYITETKHVNYIYSLQDNSNVNGTFILGGGSVKEEPVYTYYIKTNAGYMLTNIKSELCAIQESDKIKHSIVTRKNVFINNNLRRWLIEPRATPEHIVYVPNGTIIRNFNLDSKY